MRFAAEPPCVAFFCGAGLVPSTACDMCIHVPMLHARLPQHPQARPSFCRHSCVSEAFVSSPPGNLTSCKAKPMCTAICSVECSFVQPLHCFNVCEAAVTTQTPSPSVTSTVRPGLAHSHTLKARESDEVSCFDVASGCQVSPAFALPARFLKAGLRWPSVRGSSFTSLQHAIFSCEAYR